MSYYRPPEANRRVVVTDGTYTRVYNGDPWKLNRGSRSIWKPGLVVTETSDPYHAPPAEIKAMRIHPNHFDSVYPLSVSDRELVRVCYSLGRLGISTYADLLCVGSKNLLTQAGSMYDSHLSKDTVHRIGLAAAMQTGYRLREEPATPVEQLNYCTDIRAVSLAAFLPTDGFGTIRNAGYYPKRDGRDHVSVGDVVALDGARLEHHLYFMRLFRSTSDTADEFVPMQASLIQNVVIPFEAAREAAYMA
ncbi:MAG TPA: hypothetical protein VKQ34_02980 [Candidatus Saccharimonadales bacterium]|nr:hypothetical protein [Candidatus Saccharimonadales bacterium]